MNYGKGYVRVRKEVIEFNFHCCAPKIKKESDRKRCVMIHEGYIYLWLGDQNMVFSIEKKDNQWVNILYALEKQDVGYYPYQMKNGIINFKLITSLQVNSTNRYFCEIFMAMDTYGNPTMVFLSQSSSSSESVS